MNHSRKRATSRFALVASLWLAALGVPSGVAQDAGHQLAIQSVDLGLSGRYKVGHWTPLWITLQGGDEDSRVVVEVVASDGDGYSAAFHASGERAVTVPAGAAITLESYAKLARMHDGLTVRAKVDGQIVDERTYRAPQLPASVHSTQPLIVTLGPTVGIEEALKKRLRERTNPTVCVQIEDVDQLPRQWFGYASVDCVAVATSEKCLLERMDEEQFAAFDRWMRLGGRMILCVGRRGEEVFAAGARLERYCPGAQPQVTLQRNTTGLVDYAGATERLDADRGDRTRRFSLPMTVLRDVRGRVENDEIVGAEGRMPTIVRSPYGLGQVVFVAFDLDLEPFTDWQGRDGLVARILQGDRTSHDEDSEGDAGLGQVAHLGFKDLAGQLRAALDQFDGVTRAEFSWIAALIGFYILLIGPVDYFLLRRLRRPHWTWLTFPATVALFCAIAWLLQGRLTGNRLHLNQVELVDVDWDARTLRGQTWLHLYSPTSQRFDLDLRALPCVRGNGGMHSQLFAWQGLPGDGLGGVDAETNARVSSLGYGISYAGADSSIAGLPIRVSSSKALAGRWALDYVPEAGAPLPSLAVSSNGLLTGRIINPLEVELRDCLIMYENWAFSIPGSLRAGGAISVDGLEPRNLEWRLTRRRVVDTRDVSTPWEQTSFDIPRIMENMMFHQAAGGDGYTDGLTHRFHAYLDLSDHLRSGRAVLVGRSEQPVTSLLRDGQPLDEFRDRCWTICRVVFPVEKFAEAGSGD